MKILSAQIAISSDSASLYQKLVQKVVEPAQELLRALDDITLLSNTDSHPWSPARGCRAQKSGGIMKSDFRQCASSGLSVGRDLLSMRDDDINLEIGRTEKDSEGEDWHSF